MFEQGCPNLEHTFPLNVRETTFNRPDDYIKLAANCRAPAGFMVTTRGESRWEPRINFKHTETKQITLDSLH